MLASRGWQHISDRALKNGHAEHIHAHCDCQYAVRFDNNTEVEGYDPDKYLEMYENAEGDTWQEKLNAMRRENDRINKIVNLEDSTTKPVGDRIKLSGGNMKMKLQFFANKEKQFGKQKTKLYAESDNQ